MKKVLSLFLALCLTVACLGGAVFAADAECSYTVNGVTSEGTLKSAVSAVYAEGGTIKLLKDVNYTGTDYAIKVKASFTLDLNGHTLTSADSGVTVISSSTGKYATTVIMDSVGGGSIVTANYGLSIKRGGLQVKNVTIYTPNRQTIMYDETVSDWNDVNLIEDSVVVSGYWGGLSFNNTTSGATQANVLVTVRNSLLADVKVNANSGSISISCQTNAKVHLGANVRLLRYGTSDPISSKVTCTGLTPEKQAGTTSLTVAGSTFAGLTEWRTPKVELPTIEMAETVANRQAALLETAWAYYYKNPYVQYDSQDLTLVSRVRGCRNVVGKAGAPEYASPDHTIYQVCSFFVYQSVYQAFNYNIAGSWEKYKIGPVAAGEVETATLVFQHTNVANDTTGVNLAAMNEMRALLQPGDVINYHRNRTSGATHTVIWLGKDVTGDGTMDLINVDGSYYDPDTMTEKREPYGGVDINTDNYTGGMHDSGEYFLFNSASSQYLGSASGMKSYSVHRFTGAELAKTNPITEAAKTRVLYPGLEIYYQADGGVYSAVEESGELTYTVTITNNSTKNHTGILVQIPTPENAKVVKVDGAASSVETVKWTLNIAAGATVTKTFTVKPTGKVGDVITADGYVHTIALPILHTTIVKGTPTAATVTAAMNANLSKTGIAFANGILTSLHSSVSIPALSEMQEALYNHKPVTMSATGITYDLITPKEEHEISSAYLPLYTIQIPDFYGGQYVSTAMSSTRIRKDSAQDLRVGDLLLWLETDGGDVQVAVHNGTNLMKLQEGGFTAMTQTELDKFIMYRFFTALRPGRVAEEHLLDAIELLDANGEPMLSVSGGSFSVKITAEEAEDLSVAVAVYNADDKMLAFRLIPVTETTFTVPFTGLTTAKSVKIFALTELGYIPLDTVQER